MILLTSTCDRRQAADFRRNVTQCLVRAEASVTNIGVDKPDFSKAVRLFHTIPLPSVGGRSSYQTCRSTSMRASHSRLLARANASSKRTKNV